MKQGRPRLSALLLPASLTLLMLGWQGWHAYTSYGFGRNIADDLLDAEAWRDRILELDTQCLLAERMMLITGDTHWREEHVATSRALVAFVGGAVPIGPVADADGASGRLRSAAAGLLEAERKVAEAATDADSSRAQSLDFGGDHAEKHVALINALDDTMTAFRRGLDRQLARERRSEAISLGISVLILSMSLAVWAHLILRVREARDLLLREAAQRTQVEQELHRAQKMEAIGRMAGGIVHDFNNLLTAIRGFAGLARGRVPETHPASLPLRRIEEAGQQANAVVSGLLALSRKGPMHKCPVELGAMVEETAKTIQGLLPARTSLAAEIDPGEPVWVLADRSQLRQVLLNLAVNARDAMPGDGRMTIAVRRLAESFDPHSLPTATLEVSDTGEGMSAATIEHIFEPFFSTRPQDRGSGLGLAIVHRIVNDHNGRIRIRSEVGRGTTMGVELPVIAPPPSTTVSAPTRTDDGASRGLVLIAEDHRQIREVLAESLEAAGFVTLQVGHGDDLMHLFDQHRERIRLLVVDHELSGLSGLACVQRVRETGWCRPIVLISSMAADGLEDALAGEALLLRKPFPMREFIRLARQMTAEACAVDAG